MSNIWTELTYFPRGCVSWLPRVTWYGCVRPTVSTPMDAYGTDLGDLVLVVAILVAGRLQNGFIPHHQASTTRCF